MKKCKKFKKRQKNFPSGRPGRLPDSQAARLIPHEAARLMPHDAARLIPPNHSKPLLKPLKHSKPWPWCKCLSYIYIYIYISSPVRHDLRRKNSFSPPLSGGRWWWVLSRARSKYHASHGKVVFLKQQKFFLFYESLPKFEKTLD